MKRGSYPDRIFLGQRQLCSRNIDQDIQKPQPYLCLLKGFGKCLVLSLHALQPIDFSLHEVPTAFTGPASKPTES